MQRSTNHLEISVSLLVFSTLLCISIPYGFQYKVSPEQVALYFLPFSVVFVVSLVWAMICVIRNKPIYGIDIAVTALERRIGEGNSSALIGTGMVVCLLLSTVMFHSGDIVFVPWHVLCAAIVLTALAGLRFLGPQRTAILTGLIGIAVQCYLNFARPIFAESADMLPATILACRELLAGGNPYLTNLESVTTTWMYYLPGLFLPYCGFIWAAIDPRWLNVLSLTALVAICLVRMPDRYRPESMALLLFPILLTPALASMMYNGHIWPYWIFVIALVFALLDSRYLLAALALGLVLASRQTGLVFAGLLAPLVYERLPISRLLKLSAVALLVFLLALAPFAAVTPDFADITYLKISEMRLVWQGQQQNPMNQVSVAGLLRDAGMPADLTKMQLAMAVGCFFLLVRYRKLELWRGLVLVGFCYILVFSTSTILYRYYYIPGLLFVGIAFAKRGD